jgi:hypothetical protein
MTRPSPERVMICAAGQAGDETARPLRQLGFLGAFALIGQAPTPPYQRPTLTQSIAPPSS